MDIDCEQLQDAAKFYLQILVLVWEESCLTNEIEIDTSVMCLDCHKRVTGENSTLSTMSTAVQGANMVRCQQPHFNVEVVLKWECLCYL